MAQIILDRSQPEDVVISMRMTDEEAWLWRQLLDMLPEAHSIRGLESCSMEMLNDMQQMMNDLYEALSGAIGR